MADHLIVAAVVRRGDEMLLVRQQGPDDSEASWALPGGLVEPGELLHEALIRELLEETGLQARPPIRLLYVAQMDNTLSQVTSAGERPGPGDRATTFVFEVAWDGGEIQVSDPDRFVSEAAFFPTGDASRLLSEHPIRIMREPIVEFLKRPAPGSVWLYRRQLDGADVLVSALRPHSAPITEPPSRS